MRKNYGRLIIDCLILAIVVVVTISNTVLQDRCGEIPLREILFLILAVIVEFLGLGYFIIQDLFSNEKTIAKYGSLSLFDTVDRTRISEKVFKTLSEKPDRHVIYIDCAALPPIEIENIKQKLYEDLTDYKHKFTATDKERKRCAIGDVFLPTMFDMQAFNESVFYSRKKLRKKTIYLYDYATANYFFIRQIEKRLNNHERKDRNVARKTYIIYLMRTYGGVTQNMAADDANSDTLREEISVALDKKEVYEFVASRLSLRGTEAKEPTDENCHAVDHVFLLENLLTDDLNRQIIRENTEFVFPLYYLKTGEYHAALHCLRHLYHIEDLFSVYLLADALHLLNLYRESLTCLNHLYTNLVTCTKNKNADAKSNGCEKKENPEEEKYKLLSQATVKQYAHVLKHIGNFTDEQRGKNLAESSDGMFRKYEELSFKNSDTAKRKIFLNSYFCKLLAVLREETATKLSDDDPAKLFGASDDADDRMYYAAFSAFGKRTEAMLCIDEIIEFYEKTNNRRRYNAYYIKAELCRLECAYDTAYSLYLKASGIGDGHIDLNLLDQSYFSMRLLELLGLVNGTGSRQVLSYRNKYFKGDGSRTDIERYTELLSQMEQDLHMQKDEPYRLQFNEALYHYIRRAEQGSIAEDAVKNMLTENLFIIL